MTTIREAADSAVRETGRQVRAMAGIDSREHPLAPKTVLGLGECELSHGAKVYRQTGGAGVSATWILKVIWPSPIPPRGQRERPERNVRLLGTAESWDEAEEAVASMESQAAEGTEAAFRNILDDLLAAGVDPAVLHDEVNSAVVRSVMES